MVNERDYIAAEREATIREHECGEDGECTGCAAVGVDVEYPCRVRLVAERTVDALDNRSRRWPVRTEEI
jgi:hypothetical protein